MIYVGVNWSRVFIAPILQLLAIPTCLTEPDIFWWQRPSARSLVFHSTYIKSWNDWEKARLCAWKCRWEDFLKNICQTQQEKSWRKALQKYSCGVVRGKPSLFIPDFRGLTPQCNTSLIKLALSYDIVKMMITLIYRYAPALLWQSSHKSILMLRNC